MKKVCAGIDRFLSMAIGLLMAAMVLNVLWQVFTRFVLHSPSSFTEEAARYMMIWVALLGAAYATGRRSHLALDLLTGRLRGRSRRISEIFVHSVVLIFAVGVMIGGGGRLVWIGLSLGQRSAALEVQLGYVYLAVPIAGLFIACYTVMALLATMRDDSGAAEQSAGLN